MEATRENARSKQRRSLRRENGDIPGAIKKASMARMKSLGALRPQMPEWYSAAREVDRQYLKQVIEEQGRCKTYWTRPGAT